METYLLLTNVANFIGLMCVVLLLDKRRRSNIEQFNLANQVLGESLATLKAIHESNSSQSAELRAAVAQLQSSVDLVKTSVGDADRSGQITSENQTVALREELRNVTDKLSSSMEAAVKFLADLKRRPCARISTGIPRAAAS